MQIRTGVGAEVPGSLTNICKRISVVMKQFTPVPILTDLVVEVVHL